jgi:hypothetical protein
MLCCPPVKAPSGPRPITSCARHHDELTTLFARMPSAWEPLAERFGSMGLTDRGRIVAWIDE